MPREARRARWPFAGSAASRSPASPPSASDGPPDDDPPSLLAGAAGRGCEVTHRSPGSRDGSHEFGPRARDLRARAGSADARATRSSHCGRPSGPCTSCLPGRSPGAPGRTGTSLLVVREVGQRFFQDVSLFARVAQLLLELANTLGIARILFVRRSRSLASSVLLAHPVLEETASDSEIASDLGDALALFHETSGVSFELRRERTTNSCDLFSGHPDTSLTMIGLIDVSTSQGKSRRGTARSNRS